MARIAHLDVDAFYASVELQRRPELRGKPVIVSGSGPRAVVTTASYEARAFGVGSAMPTSRARRLCPDAVLIPPDFTAYREVSRVVMDLVRAAADPVEVLGLDEAYLDLEGLVAPRAAMRRLVTDIREATGLDASVGIGPNRLVAKVASDAEKPRGFVVLSREEACERFAGSPPGLIPGIGPEDRRPADRARDHDARRSSPRRRRRRSPPAFGGNHGRDLQRRARFEGSDAVVPVREAVSESRETTFDVDIADRAEMEAKLRELAAAALRAAREGRGPGAHDRDQGAPRRLHDRDAGPDAAGGDERRRRGRRTSPWRCCAATRHRAPCGCSGCAWRRSSAASRSPWTAESAAGAGDLRGAERAGL